MKYKFFGEPNMLVKNKKRNLFQNDVTFKPLFRFDSNGEYITDDIELIEKLKSRFDHMEIKEEEIIDVVNETEKPVKKNKKRGEN